MGRAVLAALLLVAAPAWALTITCDSRVIQTGSFPGLHCTINPPPIGSQYVACTWAPGDGTSCTSTCSDTCGTDFTYAYTRTGTFYVHVVCLFPNTLNSTRAVTSVRVVP